MEEMIEESLDLQEDEEIEEEADAEVNKVLFELTDGKLGQAGKVATELPVSCHPMLYICTHITYPDIDGRGPNCRRGGGENDGTVSCTTERTLELTVLLSYLITVVI